MDENVCLFSEGKGVRRVPLSVVILEVQTELCQQGPSTTQHNLDHAWPRHITVVTGWA